MIEWNIQSRAHSCAGCGNAFSNRQTYHTLLFDERAQFRRLDVCQACWETQFSQGARERKGFVSYWQGVYQAPPPHPIEPIQKETAESLLRKLIELNDPRLIPAGYILAVMLERKRLLKVKEQLVLEGRRVFVYEHPKTGDLFTIVDPGLQLNQLESVQRDVATLLEQGLNPTAPGPDTLPVAADPGPAEIGAPGSPPPCPPAPEPPPADGSFTQCAPPPPAPALEPPPQTS